MNSPLAAEDYLSARDSSLSRVIASQTTRWPSQPTEEPVWGLIRIVMAQQVSTALACRLAERVKSTYPELVTASGFTRLEVAGLRAMGLPESRARCCVTILRQSDE